MSSDGQYDYEFDGDELLYVDPVTYQVVQRLPEFAEQWTPDPGLARDTYISVGTCKYNLRPASLGEHYPPEAIGEILLMSKSNSKVWLMFTFSQL